ncbi:MAG: exosome complex protein Rrp42, partial [Candidatus Woesearchaeota archaeon]
MNAENHGYLVSAIQKNIRSDGRKCDETRETKIEYGVVATAEGSAKVTIGDTVVIAGVKMSIDKPYADTPESGNFMVNVELLPLSNPKFEAGAPSIQAIELARVTDRAIRESKAIDSKKLCIEPGKYVWGVLVDICTINDAGGLFDACALAAMAAIKDAKFPETFEENGELKVDYKKHTKNALPLDREPISVTVFKVGGELLVDPLSIEEDIAEARLTIAMIEDGTLCALQKGGEGTFTVTEVEQMVDLATKTASNLRKQL